MVKTLTAVHKLLCYLLIYHKILFVCFYTKDTRSDYATNGTVSKWNCKRKRIIVYKNDICTTEIQINFGYIIRLLFIIVNNAIAKVFALHHFSIFFLSVLYNGLTLFLDCSLYSYRSFKYCKSNSYHFSRYLRP